MPKPTTRAVRVTADDRRRVGADGEEERVAERDLAGVAGDEAEPDRADRGDAGGREQLQLRVRPARTAARGADDQEQRRASTRLSGGVEQRHAPAA